MLNKAVLSRAEGAQCTGSGSASVSFTNYSTAVKSGSVTVSGVYPEPGRREIIR